MVEAPSLPKPDALHNQAMPMKSSSGQTVRPISRRRRFIAQRHHCGPPMPPAP
jgi:hypothetical protein